MQLDVAGPALASVFVFAIAAVTARRSLPTPSQRPLILMLVFEAALQASISIANTDRLTGRPAAVNLAGTMLMLALVAATYLWLLRPLQTRLVGFLRRPASHRAVAMAVVAPAAAVVVTTLAAAQRGDGVEQLLASHGFLALLGVQFAAVIAVNLFALAASATSFFANARGTEGRQRAGAFLVAFGFRDVAFVASVIVAALLSGAPTRFGDSFVDQGSTLLMATASIVAATAIIRGVQRQQLLDLKPRTREVVQSGTVAVVFIAAYVVVSNAVFQVVAARAGLAIGLAAGAVAVAALVPLHARAERATRRLGSGRATALEAYLACVQDLRASPLDEEAAEAMLASLRRRLGVTGDQHQVAMFRLEHGGRAPAWAGPLAEGARLQGRYVLEASVGQGGEGHTWQARDDRLGRRVVIKVLPGHGSGDSLVREARALAALRHPNVVTLHDAFASGGQVFLVLEHMEGGPLSRVLAKRPLTAAEAARVAQGLMDALVAVHDAGIVHGDIKPANVLLDAEGSPKLGDFGLARGPALDADTLRGLGTTLYMSPEQARTGRATPAADRYALAATLWEAWTGARWADTETPEHPSLPPAVQAWLGTGLSGDAGRRFRDSRHMRDELQKALAHPA